MEIKDLKFDDKGLIPCIVQDADNDKVLMLAYMNEESVGITMEEKRTCFWSRSRGELWRKGETSGNTQHLCSLTADCDGDALLAVVKKDGQPAIQERKVAFLIPYLEKLAKSTLLWMIYTDYY